MQGTLHLHQRGFGFVAARDPKKFPQDIFIPKHLTGNAIHGDEVEVTLSPIQKKDKGPEGAITRVVKRGRSELVGVVTEKSAEGDFLCIIQSLGEAKGARVQAAKGKTFRVGDRLLLTVTDWGKEKERATCSVAKHLGNIEDALTDVPAAAKDFGIRDRFPKAVTAQVKQFATRVTKKDLVKRTDLTHLEAFTIDPDGARDFDDALSIEEGKEERVQLGIHIADVSHYVKEGSALDLEAKERSNSTYFPGSCIPMLPPELSNNLCSLREQVIRLTISLLVTFDKKGEVISYKIVRSYIKSRKQMTYKQAKAILDGKVKSRYYAPMKRMEALALILKERRFKRGSVDLALPEVVLKLDDGGNPIGHEIVEYDITHQLVEEFMLKANEIIAKEFEKRGENAIFRIHEPPDEESHENFCSLARSLGFKLPAKPKVEEIQQLFAQAKESPHIEQISIAYIRSMKLAIYSKENVGHYGLALESYCHFTSPIRRYSDLIIHRSLFEKSEVDFDAVAKQCSEKERLSFKAEMSVLLMKKLRLLERKQKEEPESFYEAVVSKVRPYSLSFEVSPIQYEGLVSLSDLTDDYYEYHPKSESLVGRRSRKSYKIGTPLQVRLEKIDLIKMESRWSLPYSPPPKKKSHKKRTRKKKRGNI